MPELAQYLARIGHTGPVAPDLDTLRALHRAHVASIPFEAIDVQLGEIPPMDPATIHRKLVGGGRGGWCYEMNGLFGWALEQIGFSVMRLSCGVMRQVGGDDRMGTHLALQVTIDGRPWLADVGFGCSLAEPIPLAEGEYRQDPLVVSLQQVDGYWRYTERFGDEPFSYDFRLEPADETLLVQKCEWQARAAESNFVLNFTAQRRVGDRQKLLRGRVLTERKGETESQRVLADSDEFVTVLRDTFGIEHPRLEAVWPQVCARHEQLFGSVAS